MLQEKKNAYLVHSFKRFNWAWVSFPAHSHICRQSQLGLHLSSLQQFNWLSVGQGRWHNLGHSASPHVSFIWPLLSLGSVNDADTKLIKISQVLLKSARIKSTDHPLFKKYCWSNQEIRLKRARTRFVTKGISPLSMSKYDPTFQINTVQCKIL